ncbi:mRNA surveillance protein pelota protein [Rhizoctonia solani]|uniref:Protein DOM34 homolog n=1 Tax=Rhizoctonia solani TaxID=456999 RepID=A0A8H8NP41_9AGAM|nr:mRNA surveillance protein pelota protein [Rhizoctonia solani]QRW16020.1 mRNA surveillance protein pelota protein [Rhizoctonia solani]
MQLVGRRIEKDGSGYVTLVPQDDEDMWHIYNLIQEGDDVRAAAVRRVQSVTNTGSTSSERVHLHLTLRVTKVEFSSSSSSAAGADAAQPSNGPAIPTATLSISGRVSEENRHVKMGAFHTLDLEAHRNVKIIKEHWDSIALQRVEEAIVPGRGAEVGAIVCGEGTAAICLLSEHMTVIRQRIEVPVPRKRMGSSTLHEKGLAKFYEALYAGFLRHIPVESLRVIVIASPGFTKDSVYDYIFQEATRTSNKTILQSRHKFVRIHVTSPHVHSLVDVLKSPEINVQLKETKFAREGIMLDKFFKMLGSDEARAWYGPDHVALAADRGAIGTLLISDELFRSGDVNERKKYVALVESVREKRGEVLIFSSMHETGQQLNQLTGVAAILNFPLDVEMVEAEEQAAKDEEEARAREEAEGVGQG